MPKSLYHTIRKDPYLAASLSRAPFRCIDNPWLGEGYYFWDSFIELAKWWGEVHHYGNYVVTETTAKFGGDAVFDLVGNTDHMRIFAEYAHLLEEDRKCEVTVAQILEHMKKHTGFLKTYKAVRADGRLSIRDIAKNAPYVKRIRFSLNHPQYLDLLPSIQYCVFEKSDVNSPTVAFTS